MPLAKLWKCLIVLTALIAGCTAMQSESDIRAQFLKLAPKGSSKSDALASVDARFGAPDVDVWHPCTSELFEWAGLEIRSDAEFGTYSIVYEVGSHFTFRYPICPTHVDAHMCFDESDTLLDIVVIKVIDCL